MLGVTGPAGPVSFWVSVEAWGNIWKITLPPCLFVCTANCCSWFYHLPVWYLYKFLCNFRRELVCRALQSNESMIHCSELGDRKWAATRWVTADNSWRTWLLPGAAIGWASWWQYAKFSPHGITERKRRAASCSWSVLLSYKLICMWAFRAPLILMAAKSGLANSSFRICHKNIWRRNVNLNITNNSPSYVLCHAHTEDPDGGNFKSNSQALMC